MLLKSWQKYLLGCIDVIIFRKKLFTLLPDVKLEGIPVKQLKKIPETVRKAIQYTEEVG